MKKLLAILGAFGLIVTSGTSVVSCAKPYNSYRQIMDIINDTKGKIDENGNVITKSSNAIIFLGAKDNASTRSFLDALATINNNYNRDKVLEDASYSLSKQIYNGKLLSSQSDIEIKTLINGDNNTDFSLPKDQVNDFPEDSTNLIVRVTKDNKTYQDYSPIVNGNNIDFKIKNNNNDFNIFVNEKIKIDIFSYAKNDNNSSNNKSVEAWNDIFSLWTTKTNINVGTQTAKVNLDKDSDDYGKYLGTDENNFFSGLTGSLESDIIKSSNLSLKFKGILTDEVNSFWSNGDMDKFLDFLTKDLLIGMNTFANHKDWKKNKTNVETFISTIKTSKSPTFLVIRNGHVISILNGWNQYEKYGGKTSNDNKSQDLQNWIKSIGEALIADYYNESQTPPSGEDGGSTKKGKKSYKLTKDASLFGIGSEVVANAIQKGSWAETDDNGASNFDWDKDQIK